MGLALGNHLGSKRLEILLEDIGRRFNQEWIFKKINYQFIQGQSYAILGPNGSGNRPCYKY